MAQNWCRDGWFGRLLGALKTPKNLAQPKKRGKIKATPFLDAFEVSGSESEVRISIKILVLKLSNLITLIVRNCMYLLCTWLCSGAQTPYSSGNNNRSETIPSMHWSRLQKEVPWISWASWPATWAWCPVRRSDWRGVVGEVEGVDTIERTVLMGIWVVLCCVAVIGTSLIHHRSYRSL